MDFGGQWVGGSIHHCLLSLTNGKSYDLGYDAFGRCVKRTLNGTTIYYTYDGPHPIYEWKIDGTRAGWNLYGQGIDEILLRADYQVLSNGQGYFFQQNRLGSVTHLTGFSGETIERYRYDAFGTPTTLDPILGYFNNRFKFTGREYQEAFGIYEYRNRAYHPGLGRFLSEDPTGFAGGDSNIFRYCGNDPVNGSDPYGLLDGSGGSGDGGGKPPVPLQNNAINPGVGTTVNFGSNGYTPTGSNIPQTVSGTWNGSSWDLSTHDYMNGTQSIGSFVLVGGLGGAGEGSGGGAQFVSTSTPFGRAIELATKAIEEWAAWTARERKEVAGTANSSGEIIVGPEGDRTTLTSNPGPISVDTVVVWHLHPADLPNNLSPYRFSWADQRFIDNHPSLPFVVGVPDGPAGQFTIFAWTPETPYYHYERVGPNTPRD